MREKLNYPPFCDIIVSVISGADEEMVKNESNQLYQLFKQHFNPFAPVPAPITKINNEYRWRILIKDNIDEYKIQQINDVMNAYYKQKNDLVKVSIDINPNNMM